MGADEWREAYRQDHGAELVPKTAPYERIAGAVKNDRYQRTRRQNLTELEVRDAVAAVAGQGTPATVTEKALAALRAKYRQLKAELANEKQSHAETEAKLAAERERRVAAETLAEQVLACTRPFEDAVERLRRFRAGRPAIDWNRKLIEYLKLTAAQGDRPKTIANLRTYLTPWVSWLAERSGLPTA